MKKKHFAAIAFSLLVAGVLAVTAISCGFLPEDEDDKLDLSGMNLVWSDEFDSGTTPSENNWSYEVWDKGKVNNEQQAYKKSSKYASISNGTLKIKAFKEAYAKSDFVPGDEIFFDDDFANEKLGEFPSRWDLMGGYAEVGSIDGRKVIAFTDDGFGELQPLMKEQQRFLPDVFTLEYDVFLGTPGDYEDERESGSHV